MGASVVCGSDPLALTIEDVPTTDFSVTVHGRYSIFCDRFTVGSVKDAAPRMTQKMKGRSVSNVTFLISVTRAFFCACRVNVCTDIDTLVVLYHFLPNYIIISDSNKFSSTSFEYGTHSREVHKARHVVRRWGKNNVLPRRSQPSLTLVLVLLPLFRLHCFLFSRL